MYSLAFFTSYIIPHHLVGMNIHSKVTAQCRVLTWAAEDSSSAVLAFQYLICLFSPLLRISLFLSSPLTFTSDNIFIIHVRVALSISGDFIVLDTVIVPDFSKLISFLLIQQTNLIPSLIRLSCYITGATSQVDNLSILWITIDQDWVSKSSPTYKQNNRKELLVLQHIWRNEVETENTFLKNAWGTIHLQNPTPGPSLPGRLSSFFFPSPELSSLPVMFPQGRIFPLNTCTSVLGTGKCFVELWTKLCSQLDWCKYNEINSLNQYYWS